MKVGVTSPRLLIRKSLCSFLAGIKGVSSVLELEMPLQHLERLRSLAPDIFLIDAVDPATDYEVVSQLHSLLPQAAILVLADKADDDYQLHAIRQGARGFVSADCPPEVFEKALTCASRGEFWIGHRLATRIIGKFLQREAEKQDQQPKLSKREQEILALLAKGYRNKEIASILDVSENTVRAHATSLYKKINVNSRVEAALYHFGGAKNGHHLQDSAASPNSSTVQDILAVPSHRLNPPLRHTEKASQTPATRQLGERAMLPAARA
jgi:DNA-binding NarL/FixJ family response regulator